MNIIKNPKLIYYYIKQNNITHQDFCKLSKVGYQTYINAISRQPVQDVIIFKIARTINIKFSKLLQCEKYKYNMKKCNFAVIEKFMNDNKMSKIDFCKLCAIRQFDFILIKHKYDLEDEIIERVAFFMNISPRSLFKNVK